MSFYKFLDDLWSWSWLENLVLACIFRLCLILDLRYTCAGGTGTYASHANLDAAGVYPLPAAWPKCPEKVLGYFNAILGSLGIICEVSSLRQLLVLSQNLVLV